MDRVTSHHVEPTTFVFENMTPETAAALLAVRRRGADRQDAVVCSYAEDMTAGRWLVNGIPIVISRRGIVLDGVQRLMACVEAGVAFPTFVARNYDDDVEHTIDQHHRRSCASILSARGYAHAHTLMALITRLIAYDDLTHGRAKAPAPSWGQVEGILSGNPSLQDAVAASLAIIESPLPEPVRTAILYMGRQVDPARTDRLLAAVARPETFAHGEPGALLRLELDRLAGPNPQGRERDMIFALAIKALNATLRGESLRHIAWNGRPAAGEPAEAFPMVDGYKGLVLSAPAAVRGMPEGEPPAVGFTAAFEVIDQATATRYLAMKIAKRELIKTHVAALARDIAAGRWMRNAQPICFSRNGRLMNGQHRLMAVIASHGTIEVPVVRGLPDAAYATYDTHARRSPPVEDDSGTFGDQALASAMANLLWRRERRTPSTRGKKATAAEVRQILAEFPRLLGLRGFARRMVSFGRASVMGYGAFVIERDQPQQAPGFLRGLETGADLPEGHPILALREQLQRLRRDSASQEDQLNALLAGWERFKAWQPAREVPGPKPSQDVADVLASRYARSLRLANAALHVPAAARPQRPAAVASPADPRHRTLQQSLTAAFGAFALRHDDATQLQQEAARVAAQGLAAGFAKVLEHQHDTGSLVLRAGVGWRDGVIGALRLAPGPSSPAGYAFATGQTVASNDLAADPRFTTPALLSDHGVRRAASVLIPGSGAPFGVLEVDDARAGTFSATDVCFLEAVANTLGLALDRGRAASANAMPPAEPTQALAEVRRRISQELQSVHAMLSLAARSADSTETRLALERSAVRVLSIAAVHEQLDQADRRESVEMRSYLAELVTHLQARLSGPLGGRAILLDAEAGARWPPQRARAIGLVLGELLADAMARDTDRLRIRFEDRPDGAHIALEDAGGGPPAAGSPASLSPASGVHGIGLSLAAAMLREQGGALSVVRHEGGSRVLVAFPPGVAAA